MAQTYNIEIELQAKLDEAKRVVYELNNIGNQAETLSKRLSATDAVIEGAFYHIGAKITDMAAQLPSAITATIQAFGRQEMAVQKVASAIRAQGGSVAEVLPIMQSFASEIQRITTYGDEQVLAMQAMATSMGVLPDDFTLVLRDCLVRLAPDTRDNIIRSAGAQNGKLSPNKNISIVGVGNHVLSGGLGSHYGARTGDKNGWRTIGILLVSVNGFKIENLTLQNTQAWGISIESGSSNGRISNITFDDKNDMRNQDGVDIRKGCHDITIENIFGRVGDDAVALTGYKLPIVPEKRVLGGDGMQYGGNWETGTDDIYNITIKNVRAKCLGGHGIVRLLNQDGVNMYNIIVRDIVDTATGSEPRAQATIRIGDTGYYMQRRSQMGEMRNILVDGVMAKGKVAVWIKGPLCDSAIRNVFTETPQTQRYDAPEPKERVIME